MKEPVLAVLTPIERETVHSVEMAGNVEAPIISVSINEIRAAEFVTKICRTTGHRALDHRFHGQVVALPESRLQVPWSLASARAKQVGSPEQRDQC